MSPFNRLVLNRGSHITLDSMKNHLNELRLSHLCSYAALTMSCLVGCQTTRDVADSSAPTVQSPTSVMSRASSRVSESFETAFEPLSRRSSTSACPTPQAADQAQASKLPTYPKSLARHPSQVILPNQIAQQNGASTSARSTGTTTPSANYVAKNNRGATVEFLAPPPVTQTTSKITQPVAANSPASHSERPTPKNNANSMKSTRPESTPAPIAPPEPLPAKSVSQSRAIIPTAAESGFAGNNNAITNEVATKNAANSTITSSTATPPKVTQSNAIAANTTWCRVRVRNISSEAATQVSLGVTAPTNGQLIATDGSAMSPQVNGRMDFAPVTQVGPNEEVIVTVGVVAADKHSNRLRVQVRDAQGGTNQEVQSRWKVTIEAAEQP